MKFWVVLAVLALGLHHAAAQKGDITINQQCGGAGGNCWTVKECKDAAWTSRTCSGDLGCMRVSEYHWQCANKLKLNKDGTIALNEQCGGAGGWCNEYSCKDAAWGTKKCGEGAGCVRISQFHWQCQQGAADTLIMSAGPGSMSTKKSVAGMWEQCGGQGGICRQFKVCRDQQWRPCKPGLHCDKITVWHHQCQPHKGRTQGGHSSGQPVGTIPHSEPQVIRPPGNTGNFPTGGNSQTRSVNNPQGQGQPVEIHGGTLTGNGRPVDHHDGDHSGNGQNVGQSEYPPFLPGDSAETLREAQRGFMGRKF